MTIKIATALLCALIVAGGCAGMKTDFHPVDWKHDTVNPNE